MVVKKLIKRPEINKEALEDVRQYSNAVGSNRGRQSVDNLLSKITSNKDLRDVVKQPPPPRRGY